jgi:hypothetical protein
VASALNTITRWGGSVQVRRGFWARLHREDAAAMTGGREAQGGYAAVDALVALTIFATVIVFSIASVHLSLQASRAALERREAMSLLGVLGGRPFGGAAELKGQTAPFTWQVVDDRPEPVSGAGAVCQRRAVATAQRTHRTYELVTTGVCAAELPS